MASYECSLQGIIESEAQKKAVIDRILGIAGNDSMMDLYEHEIVFTPTVQTPLGPARNDDVVLRLVSRIETDEQISLKHRQWYLCMQGNPEPQRGRSVVVRPTTRVQLGGDVFRYMKSLGYSQLYKVKTKVDISTATLFQPDGTWLIEVVSVPVAQEHVNQMATQLQKFKVLVNGIIDLEYVDNRALQNKVSYS
ncbi:hypothetical protein [Absidia glauca]|uniref:Mediator of RNA polymerase II transcription subunit 18 n=1 Tax=Absidia glauca TaxID=4829 RepID=A0A163IV50_ABSGL|nr:hypothetical protein [Absidia glauca]